jgi:hypothetical protein
MESRINLKNTQKWQFCSWILRKIPRDMTLQLLHWIHKRTWTPLQPQSVRPRIVATPWKHPLIIRLISNKVTISQNRKPPSPFLIRLYKPLRLCLLTILIPRSISPLIPRKPCLRLLRIFLPPRTTQPRVNNYNLIER